MRCPVQGARKFPLPVELRSGSGGDVGSRMSLVGSLEDLGLGEILQIVSLSRKSGRLLLRSIPLVTSKAALLKF